MVHLRTGNEVFDGSAAAGMEHQGVCRLAERSWSIWTTLIIRECRLTIWQGRGIDPAELRFHTSVARWLATGFRDLREAMGGCVFGDQESMESGPKAQLST